MTDINEKKLDKAVGGTSLFEKTGEVNFNAPICSNFVSAVDDGFACGMCKYYSRKSLKKGICTYGQSENAD